MHSVIAISEVTNFPYTMGILMKFYNEGKMPSSGIIFSGSGSAAAICILLACGLKPNEILTLLIGKIHNGTLLMKETKRVITSIIKKTYFGKDPTMKVHSLMTGRGLLFSTYDGNYIGYESTMTITSSLEQTWPSSIASSGADFDICPFLPLDKHRTIILLISKEQKNITRKALLDIRMKLASEMVTSIEIPVYVDDSAINLYIKGMNSICNIENIS